MEDLLVIVCLAFFPSGATAIKEQNAQDAHLTGAAIRPRFFCGGQRATGRAEAIWRRTASRPFGDGLAEDRLASLLQHRGRMTRDQPLLVGGEVAADEARFLDRSQTRAFVFEERVTSG
jgi:hypothetical protein